MNGAARPCPTLSTSRLVLRPHTSADFESCLALWSDPEVMRHMGGRPFTPEEVWRRMLAYAGLWATIGYGYWVIEDAASRRYVGEAGLADFHRPFAFDFAPEAGWMLAPATQGKGMAYEAMTAILEWAEAELPYRRSVCMIDPENGPSLRLAARLGYRPTGRAHYGERDLVLHER
ncbi:MAG: GNAT family N-acetyltransferase [Caulobacteraceae bacterium]|nr:GNAT family N-acetyltransferase [Caulobacteraceae bacterium]